MIRGPKSTILEVCFGLKNGLLKLGMFAEQHSASLLGLPRARCRERCQQAEVEPREWVQGLGASGSAFLRSFRVALQERQAWPSRAGLSVCDLHQPLIASVFLARAGRVRWTVSSGASSLLLPRFAEEVEQGRIGTRELSPCRGSSRVDNCPLSDELPRQIGGARRHLVLGGDLRRESQEVGGAESGRKHGPVSGSQVPHGSRMGLALPGTQCLAVVVGPLAQSFEVAGLDPCGREPGPPQRRAGSLEVLQPPHAYVSSLRSW